MTMTCASCGKPVERTFDDEWQHAATDDGLACTAWPVRAVTEQSRKRTGEAPDLSDDCPESKMSNGSHDSDWYDGGRCSWCGLGPLGNEEA